MKREIEHRGFKVTIWEKSFKVDNCPIIYIGAPPEEFVCNLEATVEYVIRTWLRRFIKGERR